MVERIGSLGLVMLALVLAGSASIAAEATNKIKKTWQTGGWRVSVESDPFETHYIMQADVVPEDNAAPSLVLSCNDGSFDIMLTSSKRVSLKYVSSIIVTDGRERVELSIGDKLGSVAFVPAKRAEYMLSSASRVGVRFKGLKDSDFYYRINNLSQGKPQLFNVCPLNH